LNCIIRKGELFAKEGVRKRKRGKGTIERIGRGSKRASIFRLEKKGRRGNICDHREGKKRGKVGKKGNDATDL